MLEGKLMSETITLEEIAETSLGQEIIRQRDERRQAKEAEAEERRLTLLAEAQATLNATAPAYEVMRDEVVRLLDDLGPKAAKLFELRAALKQALGVVLKLGAEPEAYPASLSITELRHVNEKLHAVTVTLGRSL
jgi:hypothetical protein